MKYGSSKNVVSIILFVAATVLFGAAMIRLPFYSDTLSRQTAEQKNNKALERSFGVIIKSETAKISCEYEIHAPKSSTDMPLVFTSVGLSCGCSSLKVNGRAVKVGDLVPEIDPITVAIEADFANKEGGQLLQAVLAINNQQPWVFRLTGKVLSPLSFDREAVTLHENQSDASMEGAFALTAVKKGSSPTLPRIRSSVDEKLIAFSLVGSEVKCVEGEVFVRRSDYRIRVPSTSTVSGTILTAAIDGGEDTLSIYCRREQVFIVEPPVAVLRSDPTQIGKESSIKIRSVMETPFKLKVVDSDDLIVRVGHCDGLCSEYNVAISINPSAKNASSAGALLIESSLAAQKLIRIPYAISGVNVLNSN